LLFVFSSRPQPEIPRRNVSTTSRPTLPSPTMLQPFLRKPLHGMAASPLTLCGVWLAPPTLTSSSTSQRPSFAGRWTSTTSARSRWPMPSSASG
jgi:hypothetical protein